MLKRGTGVETPGFFERFVSRCSPSCPWKVPMSTELAAKRTAEAAGKH